MVQPKGNKPRSLTLPTLAIGIVLGAIIGFSVSLTVVQETSEPMQSLVEAQCCHKLSHNGLLSASSSSKMETTDDDSSGWKMIHVFYGDRNHLVEIPPFSQAKQDEIVVGLLGNKRSGYFVDLAAHQATYISNTYILERDWDWSGLCIEANPEYWRGLSYRKCQVVAAVVGQKNMEEVNFQPTRDGALGGIEGTAFKNKPGHSKTPTTKYYTVAFRDVLSRMNAPKIMDYLSLDVEGAEFFVMQAFPFDSYSFRLISIEQPNPQLVNLMQANGYERFCDLAHFETLWVLRSEKAALDFSISVLPSNCRSK